MDNIKISLQEVNDLANKINLLNNSMYDCLMKAKNKMNELNNTWQSDGCDAIRQRFNGLSVKFDKQREIIDAYSRFLNNAANSYDALETTITFNANAINE